MSQTLQISNSLVIVRILKANNVRLQLVVESRLRERLLSGHVLVEDVPQVLDRGGDDARAAGGADDEVEGGVGEVLDDGGGDGGEGAFAGADVVCGGGDVAEGVGGCGGVGVSYLLLGEGMESQGVLMIRSDVVWIC